ncbi:PBSX family phage terminase large subunit [Staphylococcus aureus]|nr:PBSX family phage terminase large subunit [Staphylococcus aureus]UXT08895.1 PBSX family phage terminase large subunit [Staphylococcus aureus]UXT16923.1 PBSX family phage terminase large subunit [Staphylococcus aureus]UXT79460.1 PBSX family phage terminase large subunit [Staphylococcus aureus]UXU38529.1 PBSX family phage terminase large subunit [Staphylococcus aureus]
MTKVKLNFNKPSNVFNRNIFEILTNYDNFTEVHYGGGSSGKSHGVIQKVVLKALQDWKYPRRILWLRKVQSTIKDSLFEDVKDCLINFGIWDMCLWNKTDNKVELPNGAVFLFKGLDNPEKIKSIKGISDIVMEEASEFTLNDYTQLTLRLRERKHVNKQIFLMFNPVSKLNWVYKYFFEHGEPMENVMIRQSSYRDNKFLDEMTRQNLELLANRNPAYYKIYALGESEIKDLQFTYNDFNNLNTKTSIALFKYLYKNNELANYVFFDIELKNLLLYGIFDESIFLKNITNNFKEEDAKADLLNVLKEFFKLSESELLEKEIQAIEIIKDKNNENFNYKVKAYLSLLNLKGKNLYLIDGIKISELEDELVDNYDLHQNNLIVGDTINRLDLVSFSNEQLYEEIKSLKDRLINKRTTLMTSIYNQYLETILNGDFTNRTKLKEAYIGMKDIDTIEIIYNNLNKVSNELKSSNEKIINLSAFIKDNHCNNDDNIQLEYIIGEMKKLKDGTKDRVTQMCFSMLIDTLKDI